jgi:uncharacterized membrane protein
MALRLLGVLLVVSSLGGCPTPNPGDTGVVPDDAYASHTLCPPTSTLSYETFGQSFFESYCLRCHSVENVGMVARNGAPEDVNFDSVEMVRPLARRIDFMAVIGPGRTARLMPPSDPRPSDDERRMLGEWLSCGAP